MKLKILTEDHGIYFNEYTLFRYFVILEFTSYFKDYSFDLERSDLKPISEKIGISQYKLKKILLKHGGIKRWGLEPFFRTIEAAQNAINELEPYLIMSKILGE